MFASLADDAFKTPKFVFFQAVNGTVVPESVLYFIVFLLEMAVSTPPVHVSGKVRKLQINFLEEVRPN
jgi:hypothetical protein